MPVFERVQNVLARVMQVPQQQVRLESRKDDFAHWDSIRHLDLIMEIENAFSCTLTMNEATAIGSVRDVVDLIAKKVAA